MNISIKKLVNQWRKSHLFIKSFWKYAKLVVIIALSAVIVISLSGCPANVTQPPDAQKILSYAISTDVTSLDPVLQAEISPRLISAQVMETLVGYDENLKLVPLLAQSWEPLKSGQEWRFKLRDGITFHNDPCFKGTPRKVAASDVVYSLQRMLDPKSKTLGAFTLSDVVQGANEFVEGKANSVSGIVAENDTTVLIKLTKPYAQLPARLSLAFASIIPKEAVEFYKDQWGNHPVGTGAFQFKSWDTSKGEIILQRNPSYWQPITTNLSEVVFKVIKSDATQLTNFVQGQLDVFELSPALSNQVIDATGKLQGQFSEAKVTRPVTLITHYLGLNLKNNIVKDKNFRLALNYAVDKQQLIRTVLNGLAQPSNGILAKSMLGADSNTIYAQDLEKAKQLLKTSAYKGQELLYMTDNSTTSVAVAEFIQSQFAAIGVKIRIDKNPESVWIDKLVKGQYDIAKVYFGFDFPSPDNGFSQFITANFAPTGNNFYFYSNEKFDSLYTQSLKEVDPAKSAELFKQMNQIIRDDAPWVFLYSPERVILERKGIEGLKVNSLSFSLILNDVKKL